MPIILAIETATKLCSVAVGRNGVLLASRDLESEKLAHAEKVNVFIAEVLEEAGLSMQQLDAIAVGTGPGSYTGLRIGLSAAKGLCYALDKPIIGLSTLCTLVSAAREHAPVFTGVLWPMIDARRMEVFARPFDVDGIPLADAAPLILDENWAADPARRLVFGDGADKAAALWAGHPRITHVGGVQPTGASMLKTATQRYQEGRFDDLAYLVPEYGKAANVGKVKG